jgi:hypothetical protein
LSNDDAKGNRNRVPSRIERLRKLFQRERDRLKALKQYNINIKQIPSLMHERDSWIRVIKNFRELQGSWSGSIRLLLKLFEGNPRKRQ